MTNALSTSLHLVITGVLGLVVTALCCFAFFLFRTTATREQTFTEAMKVIRSATEIVSTMAERGLPSIRGRVDELESRGRTLEQMLRKSTATLEKLNSGQTEPTQTVTQALPDETALLAARRAARAAANA